VKISNKYILLIVFFFIGLIWSGINPKDQFTWIMEVFPAIIGFVILAAAYKRFRFTGLVYTFILIHCWILFIGGHYTYAEMPIFNWIRDVFHQSRNNYDKVGHFFQGFVPALIARELLIRQDVVKKRGWLAVIVVSICAAISVFYEFLEWGVAVATGEAADAFLGTQGYVWDTQSDMLYAVIGATAAVIFFSKIHDKAIKKLEEKS